MNRKRNVLAVIPGPREMGVARFDGNDLDDYGVKSLRRPGNYGKRPNFTGLILSKLIEDRHPDVLILVSKEIPDTQEGLRQIIATDTIHKVATKHGISVIELERETGRKHITGKSDATKRELSDILVARYPELAKYANMKNDSLRRYYQPLFDAVACCLTHIHTHEQKRHAR